MPGACRTIDITNVAVIAVTADGLAAVALEVLGHQSKHDMFFIDKQHE